MDPDFRDLESETVLNSSYRNVVYTVPNSLQLVLMSLTPGEDIPKETHTATTQFIRVESGIGLALVKGKVFELKPGVSLIIPPGTEHYVTNTSEKEDLKLYTIYCPPEHPKNRYQKRQTSGD